MARRSTRTRRSLLSRVARGSAWTFGLWAGLTVLPVLYLAYLPAPTSSFMLRYRLGTDGDASAPAARPPLRFAWVDFDQISESMGLAVMSAEDQKFIDHGGFDVPAIRSALADRLMGRPLRGASTLSQQVAKNLFLWPGKSFGRKALEAYFTLLIEGLWTKRRILEMYLNVAEFGEGIYGVGEAAPLYFGCPARELTPAQAALLAAVLPNPRIYHVARPSPRVRRKQQWIAGQMEYHRGVGTLARLDAGPES